MYDSTESKNPFNLNKLELEIIDKEKSNYENPRALLIEALKIVQKKHKWVPDSYIYDIASILDIPPSDIEGVATFYSQIFRQPIGKYVIRYCDSVVCYIAGYKHIKKIIEKKLNIITGQTTIDGRFTLLPVCCLGNCDKAPSLMIDDDTYINVKSENISDLLDSYK